MGEGSLVTQLIHSPFPATQLRAGTEASEALAHWARIIKNPDESTGPLARPFARTAHSFACSGLLASLAPSAALTRLLARSLRSLPRSWDSELLHGYLICVFFSSAP